MSADAQLAAFVDRILRLKAEADDIASDIKEIYQEAHANGYNKTRLGEVVTHIRKHEKDAAGEAEKAALRDLYLDAYYRAKNVPHAYARARDDDYDAETGEITEPQVAPQPAQGSDEAAEPVASQPIQPETANDFGPKAGDAAPEASEANEQGGNPVGANASHSGVTGGESAATNITPIRPAKLFRPLCQNRELCGASGPKECWKCLKAAEQGSAA